MALLLKRNLGAVRPAGPVAIDWSHPLAQDLGAYILCTSTLPGFDVTGLNFRTINGTGLTFSQAGLVSGFSATSYLTYGAGSFVSPSAQMTVMCIYVTTTTPANGDILVSRDKDSGGRPFTLEGARWYVNGGGTDLLSTTTSVGVRTMDVGTFIGSGYMGYYRNGVLQASKTAGETAIPAGTTPLEIGRRAYSGFAGPFPGSVHAVAVWKRALSQDQVRWLAVEPYAMLAGTSTVRSYFFIPGATTIAGAGASTLAGFTGSASGAETISGTLGVTLAGCTSSAAGAETDPGASAGTLAGFTSSAAGAETFSGTLGVTLAGITDAAAGAETITGSAAITLAGFTCSATNVSHGGRATVTVARYHTATVTTARYHGATVTVEEDTA